jgi:ABC-type multidrug transport system fused ATPase/permease subunit
MDSASILATGVITGLFAVLMASLTVLLALKWLKQHLFSLIIEQSLSFFDDVSKHPEAYEDLTAPLMAGAVNVVGISMNRLAADVEKNPEKYATLLRPVFQKAVKGLGGAGGAMPKFKWQDLIGMVVQRFAGNFITEAPKVAVETLVKENPFM